MTYYLDFERQSVETRYVVILFSKRLNLGVFLTLFFLFRTECSIIFKGQIRSQPIQTKYKWDLKNEGDSVFPKTEVSLI